MKKLLLAVLMGSLFVLSACSNTQKTEEPVVNTEVVEASADKSATDEPVIQEATEEQDIIEEKEASESVPPQEIDFEARLKESIDGHIYKIFEDDFDGDGIKEAFAVTYTGEEYDPEIDDSIWDYTFWFITPDRCEPVEIERPDVLRDVTDGYFADKTHAILLEKWESEINSETMVFVVKKGEPVNLGSYGNAFFDDNGKLISSHERNEYDNDGVICNRVNEITEYEYKDGELAQVNYHEEEDW